MSTSRFTIRGAELAYEVTGSGPDVIWGHGLSMDRASDADMGLLDWQQIPVTVVRYDARGHGRSESTPDLDGYRWSELAQDQLALADALGIDGYVAAGASMGCGTALHAGVLGGGRVKALVLAIPPTAWETRAAQAEQWELAASVIETDGVEAVIAARAQLDPPDPYAGDDRRRELQAAATRAWDPDRLALVMRGATRANFPDRADIARIGVPALILAWTGDPIHPMSTSEELHSLLPDSELHVASTAADLSTWTDLTRGFLKRALDS
ncbi:MAG TPA: alpha/beta fold hydrolase [Acidimicrobiales bacterium]|nr:alpha/beta fold hydrolase [Acidimicrobiales bacterium]